MVDGRDYILAEFSTFKDSFITPYIGSESDKKAFVITGVSAPVIDSDANFYSVEFDVHGKTAFIRYSIMIKLRVPRLMVESGKVKLSKIFEKLFSVGNYIAFNSSDPDFVEWMRNSDARLLIKYDYYTIDNTVYGKSEVGIYKKNGVVFSVGVMNDGKTFYPAYFKITQPFMRLKVTTQKKIITHTLKSLLMVKEITDFRVKGFDNKSQEENVVSQIISDMLNNILPKILRFGKNAFKNPEKPIICAYSITESKTVKRELINSTIV